MIVGVMGSMRLPSGWVLVVLGPPPPLSDFLLLSRSRRRGKELEGQ